MKRENAFNPTTLKFIEGGISAASGHTVRSLLQNEEARLEHTVEWGLGRLAELAMVNNPAHQGAIDQVLADFKAQMNRMKA